MHSEAHLTVVGPLASGPALLRSRPKIEDYRFARDRRVLRQRNLKASIKHEKMEERGMRLAKLSVVAAVIFTILMGGLFVGCSGGGAEVKQSNTTLGQELTDLQAAYDRGIITQREYEKAKKEILDRYK